MTDSLAAVLGQTSVATFAAEVWSRDMFFRRGDEGDDLSGLLTLDDVDELLSSRALRTPFLRIAKDGVVAPASSFTRSGGVGATVSDQIDPDKVTQLLADGSTVVFQGLHRAWRRIERFATQLSIDLGHPVQANAYLTPSSARGFAPHYDTHDVFVIQLAGSKHWTVHPPVVGRGTSIDDWTHHRQEVVAAAQGAPVFDGTCDPGDVMYLPRGWIHSARAAEATSLHLTLGVHPYTERTVLDALIADAAEGLRVDNSLPAAIDLADAESMSGTIEVVRRTLIDALTTVKAENVTARLAQRRGRDIRPRPLKPTLQVAAADSQSGDHPAKVRLRVGFTPRVEEHTNSVDLRLDEGTLTFERDHTAALRLIVAGTVFDATHLPGLDDATARALVRRLLLAGVVAPSQT